MEIADCVLSGDLLGLLKGSLEALPAQLTAAISEERHRLFGGDKKFAILGTFPDHAIVLLPESRQIYKVEYARAQNHQIVPTVASISIHTATSLAEGTKGTARTFVEAFLTGSKSLATESFQKLSTLAPRADLPTRSEHYIENFEKSVRSAGWRKTYDAKKAEIGKTISESLSPVELEAKFMKLYDGSMAANELSAFNGLVTSDVKYIQNRFEELLSQTHEANQAILRAKAAERDNPTMQGLQTFSESLVRDLKRVGTHLTEMVKSEKPIDVQAKIYDFLASELNRYEVAATFVEKMSCDLMKATTEDA